MAKLFRAPSRRGGGGGTSSTLSVQSSAGDDDVSEITDLPSPADDAATLPSTASHASQSSRSPGRRLLRGASKLQLRRKMSKQDSINEARERAAARLEPPPFTASKAFRLGQLKEAKLRAEARIVEREERSKSGSGASVASLASVRSCRTVAEEEEHSVTRGAVVFASGLLLHIALLPMRTTPSIALLLVLVQSVTLWALLSSTLSYAFDNIDFGQQMLVKNLDYGKRLFVEEVRKYSWIASVAVAAVSLLVPLGGKAIRRSAKMVCDLWDVHKMCAFAAADVEPWTAQAFRYSTVATSHLGVFCLALLAMAHLLLPRRNKRSKKGCHAARPGTIQRASTDGPPTPRSGNRGRTLKFSVSFLMATAATTNATSPPSSQTNSQRAVQSILVAGSLNADTFLPVDRFPSPGENLTLLPNFQPLVDVPGGKGCNQAIACASLGADQRSQVSFLGQFGNDAASKILQSALVDNSVDISSCGHSKIYPSGRGYVMIVPDTGEVSAVISGGSNLYGWGSWGVANGDGDAAAESVRTDEDIESILSPHSLLLLQCEVPHLVNLRLARAARKLSVPVIVDVGGEDRKMDSDLLKCCDYLVPNETELERLAKSYDDGAKDEQVDGYHGLTNQELHDLQAQIGPSLHLTSIIKSAQTLQANGADNVLVTLGSSGSILMKKRPATTGKPLLYQSACHLPAGSSVVDETGAGDCYRAGFAVALLENCGGSINGGDLDDGTLLRCMKFASAAGALAVTRKGAVPSIPSRAEVEKLLAEADNLRHTAASDVVEAIPRGGSPSDDFPFLFGSRLNSMKDRLDLVDVSSLPVATPRDYLLRQAKIRGLGCVDFNFPQHFDGYWTPEEAKKALDEVGLVAGAVCLRYPSKFARGAMNHPDPEMRREAIDITKQAAEAARILGCNEVVVWSAYDGYDYPFQVSYDEKWAQLVEAFRECCDAFPDIKWSLEYKPTDENTRFFTVPSTGAAMLLVKEIDRPNMGLTLDVGHMLMSGENPGQSIAMVGKKLFGIQLNDGYTRLAAEDGMIFGSVHPSIALEAIYQLIRINFSGHLYFDTFPQRTDPVKEAEYNIRRVKEFWTAVGKMDSNEIERIAREHDAIGALELVNEALRR
ncbi:hypothetical protein ACHAXT_012499 [Thalassiosira profunda]